MRTYFLLKDNGGGMNEVMLVYDFKSVHDLMLLSMCDEEVSGFVAILVYKVDSHRWQIGSPGGTTDRLTELVLLLEEYFLHENYRFGTSLPYASRSNPANNERQMRNDCCSEKATSLYRTTTRNIFHR